MKLLLTALSTYAVVFITWILYLAVMNLKRHRARLHPIAKLHAYPLLFVGVAFDFLVNVVVGTLIFLDPPQETLLTGRLKRYHRIAYEGTWRARLADWICTHLLDQFDPDGDHC